MCLPIVFYAFTYIVLNDCHLSVKTQFSNLYSIGSAPEIYVKVYPFAEV